MQGNARQWPHSSEVKFLRTVLHNSLKLANPFCCEEPETTPKATEDLETAQDKDRFTRQFEELETTPQATEELETAQAKDRFALQFEIGEPSLVCRSRDCTG